MGLRISASNLSPAMRTLVAGLTALTPQQTTNLSSLLTLMATPNAVIFGVRMSDNTANTQELPLTTAGAYLLNVAVDGTVSLVGGTPPQIIDVALDATMLVGATKSVPLPVSYNDANYSVVFQMNGLAGGVALLNDATKTKDGFKLKITGLVVGTITAIVIHKG